MNASKLKAAMVLHKINAESLASSIGISESAFYRKLNGTSEFTVKEVHNIRSAMGLSMEETNDIFFST